MEQRLTGERMENVELNIGVTNDGEIVFAITTMELAMSFVLFPNEAFQLAQALNNAGMSAEGTLAEEEGVN